MKRITLVVAVAAMSVVTAVPAMRTTGSGSICRTGWRTEPRGSGTSTTTMATTWIST